MAPILVQIIPRYEKWAPALIPLGLIAVNTVFAAVTTQLTNLLNSIGRVKTTFKLMVMWTVLTWALVPVLAIKYGVNGAAAAYALVGTSSVVAIYVARRYVKFSLANSVFRPGIAAVLMSGVLIGVRNQLSVSLSSVGILIALGSFSYFLAIYFLVGSSIIGDVKKSFQTLFSK